MLKVWATVTVLAGGSLVFPALADTQSSRNENSTPRDAILPISPAISRAYQQPQSASQAAEILRAKAFLAIRGYDVGSLDERPTAKFKAALFRYQRAHNLPASGDLDAQTLRRLVGQ